MLLFSEQTGQDISKVEKIQIGDNFMSADEACAYGLIDEVIAKHK